MKNFIWILLTVVILMIGFTGCSTKNREPNTSSNENNTDNSDMSSYIDENDLYGVWTLYGNGYGLYFISFWESGKYSLCLNKTLMGAGTYKLKNNKLTLYNGYLNTTDVINIEKLENKILRISGEMCKFKSDNKQRIDLKIYKTSWNYPTSKTGEVFKITGLNAYYGSTITYIQYQSEYMIKYKYCKDNSIQQVISEENWFYVYNDSKTYTQNCSGNGDVVIYELRDKYSPLSTQIVEQ